MPATDTGGTLAPQQKARAAGPHNYHPTATHDNDMSSSIIKALPAPTWSNAAPENWQPCRKKMLRYFTKAGLAWTVPEFQELTRAKPPTDDVQFMAEFSQAYCVIADTVPEANLDEINELMDTTVQDSPEAAARVDARFAAAVGHRSPDDMPDWVPRVAGSTPSELMHPGLLWAGFTEYSKGPIVGVSSGEELQSEIDSYQLPATGTYIDRVTQAITDLKAFVDRARHHGEADYPFTEALACAKFRKDMWPRFQLDYTELEQHRKLNQLGIRAKQLAKRYDQTSQLDPARAFGARGVDDAATVGGPGHVIDAFIRHVQQLGTTLDPDQVRALAGKPAGGGKPKNRISEARRKDKDAGPPGPQWRWCDNHGWSTTHDTAGCRANNPPATKTSGTALASGATTTGVTLVKNANGTYSIVESGVAHLNAFVPTEAELVSLAAAGALLPGEHLVVDCATDYSLTNSIDTLVDVKPVDRSFSMDGTNVGQPIVQTHVGTRITHVAGVRIVEHPVYFSTSNRWNLIATDTVANAGFSFKIDATSSTNQAMLIEEATGATVQLERKSQSIWVLPTSTTTTSQATLAFTTTSQTTAPTKLEPGGETTAEPERGD